MEGFDLLTEGRKI